MDHERAAVPRGDEATLFRGFHDELLCDVTRAVRTSHANIEDACAFAWSQFLLHQPDRHGNWRGWLFRVAQREAWALHRGARTSEFAVVPDGEPHLAKTPAQRDAWDVLRGKCDVDDAVESLRALPPRLREVAALRATGFRYDEIADVTGNTMTTVSRLLRRANQRINDTVGERRRAEQSSHPRACRLRELESAPPPWLVRAIGRPPTAREPVGALLQWRRTALLIDDYRTANRVRDTADAIGARPLTPDAARSYALIVTAIERTRRARHLHRAQCLER